MRGQRRLDLAQLDPEPADLDLEIGAAQVHQTGPSASQRTRSPVRYIRCPSPERTRHEPLRRQTRPGRDNPAPTAPPPYTTPRPPPPAPAATRRPARTPARSRSATRSARSRPSDSSMDRLPAVDIHRVSVGPYTLTSGHHGSRLRTVAEQTAGQRLAGEHDRVAAMPAPAGSSRTARQASTERRALIVPSAPGAAFGGASTSGPTSCSPPAHNGAKISSTDTSKPATYCQHTHRPRLNTEGRPVRSDQVDHVVVGDGDALGLAGGAGGVDDVGGVVGVQRGDPVGVGERGGVQPRQGHGVDRQGRDGRPVGVAATATAAARWWCRSGPGRGRRRRGRRRCGRWGSWDRWAGRRRRP